MTNERFNELLKKLDGDSVNTLIEKNARYSAGKDPLHNFKAGASICGGTPAQAAWGYLTKHLVALRDMIERDDFSNTEDFLEKCQDGINYIRFIWCIGNEKNDFDKATKQLTEKNVPKYKLKDIFFSKKEIAERILSELKGIIIRYGYATMADYYDLAACDSESCIGYSNEATKFGWDDLRNAKVVYVESIDSWVIEFPEAYERIF